MTDPMHDPRTLESAINHMEQNDGHLAYEVHPKSNCVPESQEPCVVEPGGEYYPLSEEPSGYQARCTCGETFSSWGQAERHVWQQ